MFIAMNRFQVLKDQAETFEQIWLTRESNLHELPGFIDFHMLRGPECENYILYASHTVWASRGEFENWTQSDQFRRAHSRAPNAKPLTLSHPQFEGFDVIQTTVASSIYR